MGEPTISPTPRLVQFIRSGVEPKALVVWNVSLFATLLWNRSYSNRIMFLPCSSNDRYPTEARALTPPTVSELRRWLGRLERLRPQFIVVYTHSAYPSAIASAGLPYHVAYSDGEEEGLGAVTVLRRG